MRVTKQILRPVSCIALMSLVVSAYPVQAERDVYDKCETTLRLCFQRCLDRGDTPRICNSACNTSACEGVGGTEKPLTEFLHWKEFNGKIWL